MILKFYFLATIVVTLHSMGFSFGADTSATDSTAHYFVNIVLELFKSCIRVYKVDIRGEVDYDIKLANTIDLPDHFITLKYSTDQFEEELTKKLQEALNTPDIETFAENIHFNVVQTTPKMLKETINKHYHDAFHKINQKRIFRHMININTLNGADKAFAIYYLLYEDKRISWNDFFVYIDENTFATGLVNLSFAHPHSEYALKRNVNYIVGFNMYYKQIGILKYRILNYLKEKEEETGSVNIVTPCYPSKTYQLDTEEKIRKVCYGCTLKNEKIEELKHYTLRGDFDFNNCRDLLESRRFKYRLDIVKEENLNQEWTDVMTLFRRHRQKLVFIQPGRHSLDTDDRNTIIDYLKDTMDNECINNQETSTTTPDACFNAFFAYYLFSLYIPANSYFKVRVPFEYGNTVYPNIAM